MTRKEANLELLKHLTEAAKTFDQLRFNQLLLVVGVVTKSDDFYEESEVTLDRTLAKLEELYLAILEKHGKGTEE